VTGDRRERQLDAILEALLPPPDQARVMATLWATVDADRAIRELRTDDEPFVQTLTDDALLGASIRLISPEQGAVIAVAEPNTEGRLAASLARAGEGPVGRYVATTVPLPEVARRAAAAGIVLSRPADGPFGPSVLVLGGPSAGPHLILVEVAAGTIDR
jgi:hypothetical protein